jgi:hypothetical protein
MHPLAPDLGKLSEEELHTKRGELQGRLNYAYRIGSTDMVNQLQLLLQDYAMEVERRNQKMLDDAQKSGRLGKPGDDTAKDLTS